MSRSIEPAGQVGAEPTLPGLAFGRSSVHCIGARP